MNNRVIEEIFFGNLVRQRSIWKLYILVVKCKIWILVVVSFAIRYNGRFFREEDYMYFVQFSGVLEVFLLLFFLNFVITGKCFSNGISSQQKIDQRRICKIFKTFLFIEKLLCKSYLSVGCTRCVLEIYFGSIKIFLNS